MSLIISRPSKKDNYDDSPERDAWEKFCVQEGYEVIFNDKFAPVDCCIRKPNGTVIAIELACNSCWTIQKEYPEDEIHIPYRKFKYFFQVIEGIPVGWPGANIAKCDKGYFVLFNTSHTKIAFLNFKTLIKNVKNFKVKKQTLNGEICKVILVPKKFLKNYKEIP